MSETTAYNIYLASRIRTKRSTLLPQSFFEELLSLHQLDAVIKRLLDSYYGQEMAKALTRFQGADAVEEAVARSMDGLFKHLSDLVENDPSLKELTLIFFQRWDLASIKSLLRGKYHHLDAGQIRKTLTPGPTLNTALLNQFLQVPTLDGLLTALAIWNPALCTPLTEVWKGHLQQTGEEQALVQLEEALDRAYFVNYSCTLKAADLNKNLLRDLLKMEIDRINIRLLLTHAGKESISFMAQRFLPEGHLSQKLLNQMASAPGMAQAMAYLEKTRYEEIHRSLYPYIQSGRITTLDRLFERAFLQALMTMTRQHMVSLAVLMHYVWARYAEVVNLRLIARGLENRLPVGRIREELVYN